MGKACTCCKTLTNCNCDTFLEEIEVDLLCQNFSIPINKTVKELQCFEIYYIGDASKRYYQPLVNSPNPTWVSDSFESFTAIYSFKSPIGEFRKSLDSFTPASKYTSFSQENNTFTISLSDERIPDGVWFDYYRNGVFIQKFLIYIKNPGLTFRDFENNRLFPEFKGLTTQILTSPIQSGQALNKTLTSKSSYKHTYSGDKWSYISQFVSFIANVPSAQQYIDCPSCIGQGFPIPDTENVACNCLASGGLRTDYSHYVAYECPGWTLDYEYSVDLVITGAFVMLNLLPGVSENLYTDIYYYVEQKLPKRIGPSSGTITGQFKHQQCLAGINGEDRWPAVCPDGFECQYNETNWPNRDINYFGPQYIYRC